MTLETRKRLMERKIVEAMMQGKSDRQICLLFKAGNRRINKIRTKAIDYGYLSGHRVLPPYPEAVFPELPDDKGLLLVSEADELLLTKKDWIVDRLEATWHPITIFEELGLAVSRSSFYRFLDRHNLHRINEHKRVVPEIIHQPGEALILDWGKLCDVFDPMTEKKRCLWAFVRVLGFSRYMMVKLVWSNDTRSTLAAIEGMLQELGGAPFKITSDNPKCFAIEASDYEPILNPAFERFASYYGIVIECLPPADPEKKGKVERMMPFVRRLYESHGQWQNIEESQAYINRKIGLANERVHGTTRLKPIEQFINVEVSALKALPAVAYAPEEVADAKVRKDGHVRFASRYYSVSECLIDEPVTVLATEEQVSIYHRGKLIEVHPRLNGSNQSQTKSTKTHHLKPWEQAMHEGSTYRKRAQSIGPDCDAMIQILLNQGQGFIDTRKVWGILSLDKSYSNAAVNEVCKKSIKLESYSYQMVKKLLQLLPKQETAQDIEQNKNIHSHKFVRPLSVYEEQLSLLIH